MAKSTSLSSDARALNELITSTLNLLNQFMTSLNPNSSTQIESQTRIHNPPNPLRVLSDSAKLVKAHTTKLSLLAINKPFTPSAIHKILKELSATCLPAMMSAVQICEQEKAVWSSMLSKEVQARVRRVFKEMETLLGEIRSIAAGTDSGTRRDSLSSTGIVWESCDALIELEKLGLPGLAVQKADQYRATIKDAIDELREWAEGDDLDSEGRVDGLLDSDDDGVDGDRDSIEDIFNAANSMPKDRPELKALVEHSQDKLKKIAILYQAIGKRRIQVFKHAPNLAGNDLEDVARLDELMLHLRRVPFLVDELASNFYDLDEDVAKETLAKCINEAKGACTAMGPDWSGTTDTFSEWLKKWTSAVG